MRQRPGPEDDAILKTARLSVLIVEDAARSGHDIADEADPPEATTALTRIVAISATRRSPVNWKARAQTTSARTPANSALVTK